MTVTTWNLNSSVLSLNDMKSSYIFLDAYNLYKHVNTKTTWILQITSIHKIKTDYFSKVHNTHFMSASPISG